MKASPVFGPVVSGQRECDPCGNKRAFCAAACNTKSQALLASNLDLKCGRLSYLPDECFDLTV